MNVYYEPNPSEWDEIIKRPTLDTTALKDKVSSVLQDIQANGDQAVLKYTSLFDQVQLDNNVVTTSEIQEAVDSLSEELKTAIQKAAANIQKFHEEQLQPIEKIEVMPGIVCWRKSVGIEKVGLYIPGGSAPLFSTILMLAIPAKIAGCKEIILCSPPNKSGKLHPAILYAANLVGVTKIFKVGGVQAIGAMAFGTETIPKVSKIFGPGNQFVMCAKQLIQEAGVAIDMPAGPSEVCVLADATAEPSFVAADLLSQAEHGPDSQVFLISTDKALLDKVRLK
jgi:histidinol dehydrogenase